MGHVQETIKRARNHAVVLAIQDSTTISYKGRTSIEGLGPIDSALKVPGFFAHTTLLVEPTQGAVLGMGHQQLWTRSWTPVSKDETSEQRKKRDRESQHWGIGQEELARAFGRQKTEGKWTPPPEGTPRIIAVFDREGDIFEVLETLQSLDHDFVIRAVRNRLSVSDKSDKNRQHSFDMVEAAPVLGRIEIDVPRKHNEAPRRALLTLRAAHMALMPPKNRNRVGQPVEVNMLLVREESPPAGIKEPLCWYLLTRLPCQALEEALVVVRYYRYRWRIEDFHMGLKTGCGVERAQLESEHGLMNFLTIASIAAWRLLGLRDAARVEVALPPPESLTDLQIRILRATFPKLGPSPDARSLLRAIARMGGFLGRKCDHEPGWRTLWRGYQRLVMMEAGATALLKAQRCGQ